MAQTNLERGAELLGLAPSPRAPSSLTALGLRAWFCAGRQGQSEG